MPRDIGADVGLVLMVGTDDVDLHAVRGGIEVLDCHFGGSDSAGPADIGVQARHVVHDADLDIDLGLGGGAEQSGGRKGQTCCDVSLFISLRCDLRPISLYQTPR